MFSGDGVCRKGKKDYLTAVLEGKKSPKRNIDEADNFVVALLLKVVTNLNLVMLCDVELISNFFHTTDLWVADRN